MSGEADGNRHYRRSPYLDGAIFIVSIRISCWLRVSCLLAVVLRHLRQGAIAYTWFCWPSHQSTFQGSDESELAGNCRRILVCRSHCRTKQEIYCRKVHMASVYSHALADCSIMRLDLQRVYYWLVYAIRSRDRVKCYNLAHEDPKLSASIARHLARSVYYYLG